MKFQNILETIGNTPHVRLARLFPKNEVWIKTERTNPGGSIKDRIALAMIEDAEKSGKLKPGGTIIEPTSGNTGIGLALAGAVKGYKVILAMPESMTIERRKGMQAFGAEFVLTPREKGMKGAIEKADELAAQIPGAWVARQFENPANPAIHAKTTAQEIITDFPNGIDYMITGVGTGGHISGVGQALKAQFPKIKILAVEPEASPVISGGAPGPHPIQGIGAGFIPKNLNLDIIDGVVKISKDEAYKGAVELARTEGIFCGVSTGASIAAVSKTLSGIDKPVSIITFGYDTGDRYLSVEDLF